ncbi:hypothetical protein QJQ45_020299 [Haematococcus lacustris]|nr:hypothetical protein QJQ45_020299 [Haematococcus lacustris]
MPSKQMLIAATARVRAKTMPRGAKAIGLLPEQSVTSHTFPCRVRQQSAYKELAAHVGIAGVAMLTTLMPYALQMTASAMAYSAGLGLFQVVYFRMLPAALGEFCTQVLGLGLRVSCQHRILASCLGCLGVGASSAFAGHVTRHVKKRAWVIATANFFMQIDNGQHGVLGNVMVPLWQDLQPQELFMDAVVGLCMFKVCKGEYRRLMPSDLRHPGALAFNSLPVPVSTRSEAPVYARGNKRSDLEAMFLRDGCHSCGTRKGRPIGDHQPPTRIFVQMQAEASAAAASQQQLHPLVQQGIKMAQGLLGMDGPGTSRQRYFPQCQSCSSRQGGLISALAAAQRAAAAEAGPAAGARALLTVGHGMPSPLVLHSIAPPGSLPGMLVASRSFYTAMDQAPPAAPSPPSRSSRKAQKPAGAASGKPSTSDRAPLPGPGAWGWGRPWYQTQSVAMSVAEPRLHQVCFPAGSGQSGDRSPQPLPYYSHAPQAGAFGSPAATDLYEDGQRSLKGRLWHPTPLSQPDSVGSSWAPSPEPGLDTPTGLGLKSPRPVGGEAESVEPSAAQQPAAIANWGLEHAHWYHYQYQQQMLHMEQQQQQPWATTSQASSVGHSQQLRLQWQQHSSQAAAMVLGHGQEPGEGPDSGLMWSLACTALDPDNPAQPHGVQSGRLQAALGRDLSGPGRQSLASHHLLFSPSASLSASMRMSKWSLSPFPTHQVTSAAVGMGDTGRQQQQQWQQHEHCKPGTAQPKTATPLTDCLPPSAPKQRMQPCPQVQQRDAAAEGSGAQLTGSTASSSQGKAAANIHLDCPPLNTSPTPCPPSHHASSNKTAAAPAGADASATLGVFNNSPGSPVPGAVSAVVVLKPSPVGQLKEQQGQASNPPHSLAGLVGGAAAAAVAKHDDQNTGSEQGQGGETDTAKDAKPRGVLEQAARLQQLLRGSGHNLSYLCIPLIVVPDRKAAAPSKVVFADSKPYASITVVVQILSRQAQAVPRRFRLGNSGLGVEKARFEGVTFIDRTCTRCTEGVVDDAMHFIFECTATSSIREQPEFAMTLQNNNDNLHDFMLSPCAPLFVHLALKCVSARGGGPPNG